MDNNNNESGFVSYGTTDTIDNQFIQNLLDNVDPTLFCMSEDEPNVVPHHQQQNDPFGLLQQGNVVPFTEPIVNQGNNNFFIPPIGGGVGNFEAGLSTTMRGKEPMFPHQFMLGNNNNFFNGGGGGGLGNFEHAPLNPIQHTNENMGPHHDADMISLPHWPPIPRPFFCSCCQVLRQIIHTNGNGTRFEKLEIHGAIGVISHAIVKSITPCGPLSVSHQMIDFCHRTAEQIKSFLVQYCAHQNELGYIIVEDPLSAHYEALCTGLDWAADISDEDDDLIPPEEPEPEPEPEPQNTRTSTSKPNMGVQREKVANMTLNDLSGMLHIPMKVAAVQLGVCVSAVKKVCRRAKLKRWPQRKVKSLMKKIAVLRRTFDSSPDPGIRVRTRAEIQRLQQEIIEQCGGITPTGIEMLQL